MVNDTNNKKMKITYDPVADALYIKVREGSVAKTREDGECIVDYGTTGDILGIKILSYSRRVSIIEPFAELKHAL